jgi:hypothetical protein
MVLKVIIKSDNKKWWFYRALSKAIYWMELVDYSNANVSGKWSRGRYMQ